MPKDMNLEFIRKFIFCNIFILNKEAGKMSDIINYHCTLDLAMFRNAYIK